MNLSHCHLQVRDLAVARRFYEGIFEFSVEFCDQHRAFLKNGAGFVLGLERRDEPETLPTWFHLGFDAGTEEKLREVFRKVRSTGQPIHADIRVADDPMTFHCSDPDGNRLEVYCRR